MCLFGPDVFQCFFSLHKSWFHAHLEVLIIWKVKQLDSHELSAIINANVRSKRLREPYLLLSSLQLHMLQLPEAPHGFHLLQVPVEGQPTQAEAVAAVTDGLQALHLFNNGGHGYGRWDSRKGEFPVFLCREWLTTYELLAWPKSTKNSLET